ncbi:MAG TPA: hypothetical protein VG013_00980 [Gemmataceae bacterium]|nr:hypothetical protein [Gemmataceae bacterium]
MSDPRTRLFGDPEVVETPHGVVYRFRGLAPPSFFGLMNSLFILAIGIIPIAAAVATLIFLIALGGRLPWYLVALPCLFVLQTGLLGGLCLRLAGPLFLRGLLFDAFGRHELELSEGWLYWGKRAGRFRQGYRHAVADLRCLLVYCYTSSGGEREAHLGVDPLSGKEPTFYCCCCSEQEVLALARDLQRHADVPLEIRETTEDEAWLRAGLTGRPVLPTRPALWQRWYAWYPWHIGGLVGLLALLKAVGSADLGLPWWVYLLFMVGLWLELALIGSGLTGSRRRERSS